MYTSQGCNFCRRHGMPILPVRPALMEQDDSLPSLPDSLSVPISAEGGVNYTARLLREGFLYIWAEHGQRWLNYYVTRDGYFYPLPEDGSVLPRLVEGEMKPCISSPEELAMASLITLPVKPAGIPNGVYWFSWSEEQWTPSVRKQHEQTDWQHRYMQKFDLDAWLMTHQGQQAQPFDTLPRLVAEYSPGFRNSAIKHWTPSPLKGLTPHSATDLQQAAQALDADNAAILLLPDPLAVTMEISALAHYRMNQAISGDPALKRGTALMTMINSVELAMRNYFFLAAEEGDERHETRMRYGWDSPAGPHFPAPEVADRMRVLNEACREDRVDERWLNHYEKYIDRAKVAAFNERLKNWLTEYDHRSVVPITRMYLAWLQVPAMTDYFVQHFDPACARSGGRYIQTVAKVLSGMNDKGGVIAYIDQQLNQAPLTRENFLQRAAFFNHDAWIAQVDAELKTGGPDWWLGISWDRLADGAKEYSGHYAGAILTGLEKLSLLCSDAMMKSVDLMVKGTPVRVAIGILAMQGKAFSAIPVQPGTKNFVRAMTRGMAGMLEMSGRSGGQLYSAMRKLAERLVKDLPDSTQKRILLPRIVDVEAAKALAAMPAKDRLAKLGTAMLSEDELVRMLFPRTLGSSVAKQRGMSSSLLAQEMAASGMKFGGTVFSAYFQWMVLHYGVEKSGLPSGGKARAVFGANASMALASTAEMLKLAMKPLMSLELPSAISVVRNGAMKIVGAGAWGGLGYGGGLVYTGIEVFDGVVGIKEGNYSIGIAHMINAVGVGMMTVGGGSKISIAILGRLGLSATILGSSELAAFFLGPAGIFVGMLLVLGAGGWLLSHTRDDVQTWLLSMQWRRVPPGEDNIPAIYPNDRMEKEGYMDLTVQGEQHV